MTLPEATAYASHLDQLQRERYARVVALALAEADGDARAAADEQREIDRLTAEIRRMEK